MPERAHPVTESAQDERTAQAFFWGAGEPPAWGYTLGAVPPPPFENPVCAPDQLSRSLTFYSTFKMTFKREMKVIFVFSVLHLILERDLEDICIRR